MSSRVLVAWTLLQRLVVSGGGVVLSSNARNLAAKLTDAGLSDDEAFEWVREILAEAWNEGFKQGGPMHDVNYDDPGAHMQNPYE